jgi:hypothetical protein
MKRILILSLIFTPIFAGPGSYIGFELEKMWVYEGWKMDSSVVGVEVDTTLDTVFVSDTLNYLGNPAFVLKRITNIVGGGTSISTDTLWESGDFLYGGFDLPWDSTISVALYKTPFTPGDTWSLGITGTYVVELDSPPDGIMDTVDIYYDKCKILGVETVSPPFGTIQDEYKIERAIEFDIWISSSGQGGPFNGSGSDSIYEWVKPGFGPVIDSSELRVTIIVIIFPVTEVNRTYHALSDTGRYTLVEESVTFRGEPSFIIRDGEILLSFPEEGGNFSLFDVTGRFLGKYLYRGNSREIWNIKNLRRGVYLLLYRNRGHLKSWKIILFK